MKCPQCDHVQRRAQGQVCASCRYVYRLDHKKFPFVTDRVAHRSTVVVGDGGERPFVAAQVVTHLIQKRKIKLWRGRRQRNRRYSLARAAITEYLSQTMPEGYVSSPSFESLAAVAWPEPDIHDYGAERILVVDSRLAVDLLVRLWVHTNAKAIIVSADGYPRDVAERVRRLVGDRPDVPVYALSSSGRDKVALIAEVRRRFDLGDRHPVVDLGFPADIARTNPSFAWAYKLDDLPVLASSHRILSSSLVNALLTERMLDDAGNSARGDGSTGGPDTVLWVGDDGDDHPAGGWMDDGDDFG